MSRAKRHEIKAYLATVPNAPVEWVDIMYGSRMSMAVIDKFVQRMSVEIDSPLRVAEDAQLNKEIARVNGVFSNLADGGKGNGRPVVRLSAVLTAGEMVRLNSLVGNFCQPEVKASGRFGRNGHAVMNAVRRCAAGYQFTKLPKGSRVVEVGPDVKNWVLDSSVKPWETGRGEYVGARPVKSQRDVLRVGWSSLVDRVLNAGPEVYSDLVRTRAGRLHDAYSSTFPAVDVQGVVGSYEYVVSNDSNYDIKFSDMPAVMISFGARAWYGTMLRVKGLTRHTRMESGSLDMMGVNYRVDWKKSGRIDFRNPTCNAFGYSHDVHELVKYEERNGYVWTTANANYVYAKGPETNDELLFFSVVRVSKAIYMAQPSFVEHPHAGMAIIKSVWAVGGWVDGVPTRFEPVEFHADPVALGKVYEKRRALDHRGDFSQTLTLVKSTNVRMWLNGTPVGANRRISVALMEAVAVAVEAVVSQSRLSSNLIFSKAMKSYAVSMERGSWMRNLLTNVFDMRAIVGSVTGPVSRGWSSVRGSLVDVALSSVSDIKVEIGLEGMHVEGDLIGRSERLVSSKSELDPCGCPGECKVCNLIADEWVASVGSGESSSGDETLVSNTSCDESSVSTDWSEPELEVADETVLVKGWNEDACDDMVEKRAMKEAVFVTQYLKTATMSEVRIDARRLSRAGCETNRSVLEHCTARTEHTLVRFRSGVAVSRLGAENPDFSAVYHVGDDRVHLVSCRGGVARANVKDGWYYTNNHMRVWNHDELCAAVEYAIDYGIMRSHRQLFSVVLGVPGAGKTYTMMRDLFTRFQETGLLFVVLSVTGKAAAEAIRKGVEHGFDEKLLLGRVKTLDSYLINGRFPADMVCVDEFPMAHAGFIDAAVSISGAKEVVLYGDGRQIPYDPFTAELSLAHASVSGSVDEEKISFMDVTHRLRVDTCAAWVDLYPTIRSCDCHGLDVKDSSSMEVVRISSVDDIVKNDSVRYHVYTRGEYDDMAVALRFRGDRRLMKLQENTGLASVHEDQGSTHKNVSTVRLRADFDKNASVHNPSLYNRLNYVLTDQTRDTHGYTYYTCSTEDDMICKRVRASRDPVRQNLVREGKGMGLTSIADMLANRYHGDIVSGRSLRA